MDDRGRPFILVMQLATPNLWNSFCKYTASVNAAWARQHHHGYLMTAGEYLHSDDIWRGGNTRAVLEVMSSAPDEVEWLFHLDCDAALVDFSLDDALSRALMKFGTVQTEVLLSRDESGFAGSSRLVNMGTGMWRRSAWTRRFLERLWADMASTPGRNEQEVVEAFLKDNVEGCQSRIAILPAGTLNSESANAVAAPPVRQPVVHLAGMPAPLRSRLFGSLWADVCAVPGKRRLGLHDAGADVWALQRLFLDELRSHALSIPDEPSLTPPPSRPTGDLIDGQSVSRGADSSEDLLANSAAAAPPPSPSSSPWAAASEPARAARRAGLALLSAGRHREEAERFFRLALKRIEMLEALVSKRAPGYGADMEAPLGQFMESLSSPLLELGYPAEAAALLSRPRSAAAGPRHPVDELVHLDSLSAVLAKEGRLAEAEPLARRALAGFEAAFPASASDLRPAAARARLSHIRHLLGDASEAEALLRQALVEYERSVGRDHPQALGCARNLAVLLKQIAATLDPGSPRRQEMLKEAESLLVRASKGLTSALGAEHPDAGRATANLANFRLWRDRSEL